MNLPSWQWFIGHMSVVSSFLFTLQQDAVFAYLQCSSAGGWFNLYHYVTPLLFCNSSIVVILSHYWYAFFFYMAMQERILDELSMEMETTSNRLDFVQVSFHILLFRRCLHFFASSCSFP